MAYDGKILRRACQKFEEDRQQRQERFQSRRESIFLRQPRLRQIEGELRATMSRIIASALRRGTDPLPAVEVLREENLGLQEEKRRLLAQMGLPEDALEEKPACPLCGDSGYRGGQVCRCLRKYYAREQQKELSRMLDLGGQSFETFSLSWYSDTYDPALGISPRKNMARILEICRSYAETFSQDSGSLLLTGDPGLGKTFLSAAIARVVSGDGWSVVYDTAGRIFQRFEAQKFGREEGDGASADVERVLGCDLLIHHPQYEPEGGGAAQPVFAPDRLPDRGRVSDPAVFRRGHPPAEAGERLNPIKLHTRGAGPLLRSGAFFLPGA